MTDRYEDVIGQLDGYTISSTLLSQTRVMVHHTESKMIKVMTTIYRDQAPEVEYLVSLNNGLDIFTTSSLEEAVQTYLGV